MSFNHFARKVRDPRRTIGVRRSAFGSCILRFGWLTHQKYSAVRDRFAPQFGHDRDDPLTEHDLLDALSAMERERNCVLERLRAYQIRRVREKARGIRIPKESQRQITSPDARR